MQYPPLPPRSQDVITRRTQRSHPAFEPSDFPPEPPAGYPPPVIEGQGHTAALQVPPPPDRWSKARNWVWLGGVLWGVGAALAGGAGWMFGAGQKAATYATTAYVDTSSRAQLEATKQVAAEVQALRERMIVTETRRASDSEAIKEIKDTVKELANRPGRR